MGDDANFSTTVTNSIATKLPLAGGTLTGNLTLVGTPTDTNHAATKAYVDLLTAAVTVDGGNFANGTSLVSNTSTIDGGSF